MERKINKNFTKIKFCAEKKATSEKIQNRQSKIQNENGGENRTRTCKPVRAVVFKTTALPIMLSLRTFEAETENIAQSYAINKSKLLF